MYTEPSAKEHFVGRTPSVDGTQILAARNLSYMDRIICQKGCLC